MSPIEETHHQKRRRTPTGEKGPSSHLPLPLPISHLPLRSSSFNSISRLELSSLPRLPALLKDSPVSFVCDLLNAGSDPYTLTPSFDNYRGQETLSPGFVSFILSEQEPNNPPLDSGSLHRLRGLHVCLCQPKVGLALVTSLGVPGRCLIELYLVLFLLPINPRDQSTVIFLWTPRLFLVSRTSFWPLGPVAIIH